jgi:carnitine-CoA ligase
MNNLAELISARSSEFPGTAFGVAEDDATTLSDVFQMAEKLATALGMAGLKAGNCSAVIGPTSTSYLITWMALQIGGIQAALINPSYPDELLRQMLVDLDPEAVIWVGPTPKPTVAPHLLHFDASRVAECYLATGADAPVLLPSTATDLSGLRASLTDIAGYMHTSGTSGRPKFCAQSHEYYLRLGRYVADTMGFTPADTVFAPLPMFHINPLGYGLVGGLTAGSGVLASKGFSASQFWPLVKEHEVTALILHRAPLEILRERTNKQDSNGHRVRIAFGANPTFLEHFDIPQGLSAYGSTEAGGVSHMWKWRPGDRWDVSEGTTHYAGPGRYDIEWTVDDDGEILVRNRVGAALFSGYRSGGGIDKSTDESGFFHTGDLGRIDEYGNLIFIARASESIRVKGEYVPIEFVEERLRGIHELGDFAIWRRPAPLGGDEVVLYTDAESVPIEGIRSVISDLPPFMRPVVAIRVSKIPRDSGVGKVPRRLLDELASVENIPL